MMFHFFRRISATCIFIILFSFSATISAKRSTSPPPDPTPTVAGTTELVSKSSNGSQGNKQSYRSKITSDGRFVVFSSSSSNLVPNDNNGQYDIFVHDRNTGITDRASIASDGSEADKSSDYGSISSDGRYVAFTSSASNLVAGAQTSFSQVYVHDRVSGSTERVSISTGGNLANASSYSPNISQDGRYVAFSSAANNLISNDTNGNNADIFVHDRLAGTTERVSVASNGSEGNLGSAVPAMSADGQTLVFLSYANNLVAGDNNNSPDIFVHNRVSGITERVSVASNGTQANNRSGSPAISADGQVVSFTSVATNLVSGDTNNFNDVFVHDRTTGTTERVSKDNDGRQGNDESFGGSLSADGRLVAFFSYANNLDMPYSYANWWYSGVFVFDRVTQTLEQISLTVDGLQPSGDSYYPSISADGRFVSFESYASDLITNDSGGYTNDIFVRDRNP